MTLFQTYLLALVALLSLSVGCIGCVTRAEVDALAWLNNGLPKEICDREPELANYGLFRRLNDGKFEFLSYCQFGENGKNLVMDYTAFSNADLEKLLDELTPKKGGK